MADNTKAAVKKKRGNIFKRIGKFFKEVVAELKRVSWPSKKELWTYTGAVIVFVIIAAVFIGVLDVVFAWGMRLIVG